MAVEGEDDGEQAGAGADEDESEDGGAAGILEPGGALGAGGVTSEDGGPGEQQEQDRIKIPGAQDADGNGHAGQDEEGHDGQRQGDPLAVIRVEPGERGKGGMRAARGPG